MYVNDIKINVIEGIFPTSYLTSLDYQQPKWNMTRHEIGSTAAEVPVKFQSDWKSINSNPAASRLHKILP